MIWISKQTASEGHFSIGGQSFRSSSDPSPCPRGGEPRIGPLANEIALKLGQCSHQMEGEFPSWYCRVDALSQRDKIDSSIFEVRRLSVSIRSLSERPRRLSFQTTTDFATHLYA